MRLLSRTLIFLAALIAVVFAVNNRTMVTLDLWPLAATEAPVYAVALIAGFGGYCLGGFAAWLQGGRWRRRARDAEKRAESAESAIAIRAAEDRERIASTTIASTTQALPPS
ncbi:MAG: LapA family protein [Alphaproteobacteria bacterium]